MRNQFLVLGLLAAGMAWSDQSPAITCGTGDALAGVDIYIDQATGDSKVVLLSQADAPQGQDKAYTFKLTADDGAALKAGNQITVTATSPDSFDFGGETTHALLMNLKVNTSVFSYDRNTQLAEGGSVFGLFCNKAGLTPPPN